MVVSTCCLRLECTEEMCGREVHVVPPKDRPEASYVPHGNTRSNAKLNREWQGMVGAEALRVGVRLDVRESAWAGPPAAQGHTRSSSS